VIDAGRAAFVHDTIAAQCVRLDCKPIAVSSAVDHVHLLCRLSPKVPVMEVVRATKSASAVLFNRSFGAEVLRWQEGYGEFSVSPWDVAVVAEYVRTQRQRHRSGEINHWLEDVPRTDSGSGRSGSSIGDDARRTVLPLLPRRSRD
jgi:putative transposase